MQSILPVQCNELVISELLQQNTKKNQMPKHFWSNAINWWYQNYCTKKPNTKIPKYFLLNAMRWFHYHHNLQEWDWSSSSSRSRSSCFFVNKFLKHLGTHLKPHFSWQANTQRLHQNIYTITLCRRAGSWDCTTRAWTWRWLGMCPRQRPAPPWRILRGWEVWEFIVVYLLLSFLLLSLFICLLFFCCHCLCCNCSCDHNNDQHDPGGYWGGEECESLLWSTCCCRCFCCHYLCCYCFCVHDDDKYNSGGYRGGEHCESRIGRQSNIGNEHIQLSIVHVFRNVLTYFEKVQAAKKNYCCPMIFEWKIIVVQYCIGRRCRSPCRPEILLLL